MRFTSALSQSVDPVNLGWCAALGGLTLQALGLALGGEALGVLSAFGLLLGSGGMGLLWRSMGRGASADQGLHRSAQQQAQERLQLERELRQAIGSGQFELHYQPILSLTGVRHAGVEGLVRWRHPKRGLVSPAVFIPLAEKSGTVIELGRWVIEQVCRDIGSWKAQGLWREGWYASFNLSARQLDDPRLLEVIEQATAMRGVQPEDLRLELTESTFVERRDQAFGLFDSLAERGHLVCMDDFGTGYSSLSSLSSLPFSVLKLDKSFVDGLVDDPHRQALVSGVLALAAKLELQVVAEGVELPAQAQWLREAGCGWVQGYLYSKPLDPAAIREWLSQAVRLEAVSEEAVEQAT